MPQLIRHCFEIDYLKVLATNALKEVKKSFTQSGDSGFRKQTRGTRKKPVADKKDNM